MNPDLEAAIERGLPEVFTPREFENWWTGKDTLWDYYGLIPLGFRYSPKAIRGLLLGMIHGVYTEEGYYKPPSWQFSMTSAFYGYFNYFLTGEEAFGKEKIRANFAETPGELWISPSNEKITNKIVMSIEEAALITHNMKQDNPDFKVIFYHGKWNCVPHPGHMYYIRGTITDVNNLYDVPHENIVTVVACDSNYNIRTLGARPFLNSAFRMSLMSYLPWVVIVCPTGNYFDANLGDNHFAYKYNILKPDFLATEIDDSLTEKKNLRAKEAGIEIITHWREGAYVPFEVGNPTLVKLPEPEISSTNIMEGTIANPGEPDFTFTNPMNRLMAIKQIREELYGPREWFK